MGHTADLDSFLNFHRNQLVTSGIPELFWGMLHVKLQNQIFDIGSIVNLVNFEFEGKREEHEPVRGLQSLESISETDPKNVFLIDHAWTYRLNNAKEQLLGNDSLRYRLSGMLGLDSELGKEELTNLILDNVWRLCSTYSIDSFQDVEDRLPIWYVMDEIGSAVIHSDLPNCRIVPFVYANENVTYSVLFPTTEISEGDILTKDWVEGVKGDMRKAAVLPWQPNLFEEVDIVPRNPGADYYLSGHIRESLPQSKYLKNKKTIKDKYKVFTQYSLVENFLTDPKFKLADKETEADILWYTQHFKNFRLLSETPDVFVNQFPFEHVVTVKDLLSLVCRRCRQTDFFSLDNWLPTTYNLRTELNNFVAYFRKREKEGSDNYWIIKPYNLARGMDTHITNNLNCCVRLATSGFRIAQKYITKPVLFRVPQAFDPVKFDVRYVVLLKSVKPLKIYVYRNFFLRFSNLPFELNDFHVYEKHFTVMNYTENANINHMLCSEFKLKWEEQYPSHPWDEVEKDISSMLKGVFEAASSEEPPCGIAESPQSRAVYAADIMLEWRNASEMRPKLLEINWTPDCKRACDYYPDFFNKIFRLLFCDIEDDAFIEI